MSSFLFSLFSVLAVADNTFYLSNVFGDNMVLQARVPSVVWGFAKTGAVITTRFRDQVLNTTAGGNFIWRQVLPAMNASSTPYNLFFSSSSGGSPASLLNVLFGEVFVCGGQSNMQMSVSAVFNATEEISAAHYPNIRVFTVGQNISNSPISNLESVLQPWTPVTPSSISNNDDFGYFSAICYFFARDLQATLGSDVPIGVISDNWGGKCLQEWALPEINQECGQPYNPVIYNAMYRPYTVGPMSITGFIWSQGECNADSNTTAYYSCAFPLFIQSLRTQFNNSNMFFGFELLPAYIQDASFDPSSLPYEREAQLNGLTAGGKVAVCNAIDLGDPSAPHGSVHPRNKQDVGKRLANSALALVYGYTNVSYLNPTYESSNVLYNGTNITLIINFKPETLGLGGVLFLLSSTTCPSSVPSSECTWDQVQTEDGVWYNASSSLSADNKKLILSITTVKPMRANATRGSFSPWPVVHLYGSNGLPALPWNEPVVDQDSCVVRVGGKVYDFTSLEQSTSVLPLAWIDMSSPPMYEYDFTFCGAKTQFCANSSSNLCQKQLQSPFGEVSFGSWNASFTAIAGGIQSVFTGDKCQTTNRQSIVNLLCTQQPNITFIQNVSNIAPCLSTITIQLQRDICSTLPPTPPTTQAPSFAPTTPVPTTLSPTSAPLRPTSAPSFATPCVVTVNGTSYDFSDLEARSAVNPFVWIDNNMPPMYEYDLTFCRARISACNNSNICQTSLVTLADYNNGVGSWPQMNWRAIDGGIQTQFNGSACGIAGIRQTTLSLLCKGASNETSIISVTEDTQCHYSMRVQLEASVCSVPTSQPTSSSPTQAPSSLAPTSLAPTSASACVYNVGGWTYNLTSLEILSAQQPFPFNDTDFNYDVTFCSSRVRACGPNSNICQQSKNKTFPSIYNLGMWNNDWTLGDGGIQATFYNGSLCRGEVPRRTDVLLSCKDAVDRATVVSIVEGATCEYSMVVDIPRSLCPPTPVPPPPTPAPTFPSKCVISVGNTNYDFSALEVQTSRNPLIFADSNFEYDFAICRARTQRCQSNASICQLSLVGDKETSLGVWNPRWTAIDGGFQTIFIQGDVCGTAGKMIQTTVTFLCKGNFNQTTLINVSSTVACQYSAVVQLQSSVCFPIAPPTPATPPKSTNWASIVAIIAGAVLIVGALIFLACRRKGLASEGYRPV